MKFKTVPCHRTNIGPKRRYDRIEYIVVHYTANKHDTALNNCKYYQYANRKASAHYYVDEENLIYKSCALNRVGWSVGGNKWSDYKRTGGGKLYHICTNANSLSIEMCNSVTRNKKVEENTLWLIRFLIKKYGIKKENVVRHFDVTGKYCPITLMDGKAWKDFKSRI